MLDDVFGPEGLGAVRGLDGFKGLLTVGGSEGDVLLRVPVLGEDDMVEFLGEGVDEGDYSVAIGDREIASGHEVVLDVDNEEGVGGLELHGELMVEQGAGSAVVVCITPSYRR